MNAYKTIRIVKCSDALLWYASCIGDTLTVIATDGIAREYIVRQHNTEYPYLNVVKFDDSVEI